MLCEQSQQLLTMAISSARHSDVNVNIAVCDPGGNLCAKTFDPRTVYAPYKKNSKQDQDQNSQNQPAQRPGVFAAV